MPFFPSHSPARHNDDGEYTVSLPVPMEDEPLHTTDHPFCYDDTCVCHEDPDLIGEVNTAYQDGLLTSKEATNVTRGRTVSCLFVCSLFQRTTLLMTMHYQQQAFQ